MKAVFFNFFLFSKSSVLFYYYFDFGSFCIFSFTLWLEIVWVFFIWVAEL